MTALQELQTFAQALAPVCQTNQLRLVCAKSENDLFLETGLLFGSPLVLTLIAENLVCGHLLPLAEGTNFFIQVRTPFAASATLKIITLRTYSLIVVRSRVLEPKTMERDLSPSPGKLDTWDLLAQANGAILQARTPEQVVLQLGESAPFPMKKIEWVACRSTILAGCVAGTLPAASEGGTGDDGPSPVSLYLL